MAECNVEDILCQIEALRGMRAIRTALGSEAFLTKFPELEGLDSKLIKEIQATKGNIREALVECGNIDLEDSEFETLEEATSPGGLNEARMY